MPWCVYLGSQEKSAKKRKKRKRGGLIRAPRKFGEERENQGKKKKKKMAKRLEYILTPGLFMHASPEQGGRRACLKYHIRRICEKHKNICALLYWEKTALRLIHETYIAFSRKILFLQGKHYLLDLAFVCFLRFSFLISFLFFLPRWSFCPSFFSPALRTPFCWPEGPLKKSWGFPSFLLGSLRARKKAKDAPQTARLDKKGTFAIQFLANSKLNACRTLSLSSKVVQYSSKHNVVK